MRGGTAGAREANNEDKVPFSEDEADKIRQRYGGKALGLLILQKLAKRLGFKVPELELIATEIFDRFLEHNDITRDMIKGIYDSPTDTREIDGKINPIFRKGEFRDDDKALLRQIFEQMRSKDKPITIRSSSVMEDGKDYQFKGIYDSEFMVFSDDIEADFKEFIDKIKHVYAGIFRLKAFRYRLERELPDTDKMGIIIQQAVGKRHENRFYPPISGVTLFEPYNPNATVSYVNFGLNTKTVRGEYKYKIAYIIDPSGKVHSSWTVPSVESGPGRHVDEWDYMEIESGYVRHNFNDTEGWIGDREFFIVYKQDKAGFLESMKQDSPNINLVEPFTARMDKIARAVREQLGPIEIEWSVDDAGELNIYQCRHSYDFRRFYNLSVQIRDISTERIIAESNIVSGHGEISGPLVAVSDMAQIQSKETNDCGLEKADELGCDGYIVVADFNKLMRSLSFTEDVAYFVSYFLPMMKGIINISDEPIPLAAHWSEDLIANNILVISSSRINQPLINQIMIEDELGDIRYSDKAVHMVVNGVEQRGQAYLVEENGGVSIFGSAASNPATPQAPMEEGAESRANGVSRGASSPARSAVRLRLVGYNGWQDSESLRNAIMEIEHSLLPLMQATEKGIEDILRQDGAIFLIAEAQNAKIAGYILGCPLQLEPCKFIVVSWVVRSEFRSRGIGRMLREKMIRRAEASDYVSLFIHVRVGFAQGWKDTRGKPPVFVRMRKDYFGLGEDAEFLILQLYKKGSSPEQEMRRAILSSLHYSHLRLPQGEAPTLTGRKKSVVGRGYNARSPPRFRFYPYHINVPIRTPLFKAIFNAILQALVEPLGLLVMISGVYLFTRGAVFPSSEKNPNPVLIRYCMQSVGVTVALIPPSIAAYLHYRHKRKPTDKSSSSSVSSNKSNDNASSPASSKKNRNLPIIKLRVGILAILLAFLPLIPGEGARQVRIITEEALQQLRDEIYPVPNHFLAGIKENQQVVENPKGFSIVPDVDVSMEAAVFQVTSSDTALTAANLAALLDYDVRIIVIANSQYAAYEILNALRNKGVKNLDQRLRIIIDDISSNWARDPYLVLVNPQTHQYTLFPAEGKTHIVWDPMAAAYLMDSDIGWDALIASEFDIDVLNIANGDIRSDDTYVYVGRDSLRSCCYDSEERKILTEEQVIKKLEFITGKKVIVLDGPDRHNDRYHVPLGRTKYGEHTSLVADPILFLDILAALSAQERNEAVENIFHELQRAPKYSMMGIPRPEVTRDAVREMLTVTPEERRKIENSSYVEQLQKVRQELAAQGIAVRSIPGMMREHVDRQMLGFYYTNVQMNTRSNTGRRSVIVPHYSIPTLDEYVDNTYRDVGFYDIRPFNSVIAGRLKGGPRCLMQVMGLPLEVISKPASSPAHDTESSGEIEKERAEIDIVERHARNILEQLKGSRPKIIVFYGPHRPLEPTSLIIEQLKTEMSLRWQRYSTDDVSFVEVPYEMTPQGYAIGAYEFLVDTAQRMAEGKVALVGEGYSEDGNMIFGAVLLRLIRGIESRQGILVERLLAGVKEGNGKARQFIEAEIGPILDEFTRGLNIDFRGILNVLRDRYPAQPAEEVLCQRLAKDLPGTHFIFLHGHFITSSTYETGISDKGIHVTARNKALYGRISEELNSGLDPYSDGRWSPAHAVYYENSYLRKRLDIASFDRGVNYAYFELPQWPDFCVDDNELSVRAVVGAYFLPDPYLGSIIPSTGFSKGSTSAWDMDYFVSSNFPDAARIALLIQQFLNKLSVAVSSPVNNLAVAASPALSSQHVTTSQGHQFSPQSTVDGQQSDEASCPERLVVSEPIRLRSGFVLSLPKDEVEPSRRASSPAGFNLQSTVNGPKEEESSFVRLILEKLTEGSRKEDFSEASKVPIGKERQPFEPGDYAYEHPYKWFLISISGALVNLPLFLYTLHYVTNMLVSYELQFVDYIVAGMLLGISYLNGVGFLSAFFLPKEKDIVGYNINSPILKILFSPGSIPHELGHAFMAKLFGLKIRFGVVSVGVGVKKCFRKSDYENMRYAVNILRERRLFPFSSGYQRLCRSILRVFSRQRSATTNTTGKSNDDSFVYIVLLAGKGKRFSQTMSKVLYPVLGEDMSRRAIKPAQELGMKIIAVVGFQAPEVIKRLGSGVSYVQQGTADGKGQLGTAHAVMQTEQLLKGYQGNIIVVPGDVVGIDKDILELLKRAHLPSTGRRASATILTATVENSKGYGRILRRKDKSAERIIEQREIDALAETDRIRLSDGTELSKGQLESIKEINTGIYAFEAAALFRVLPSIRPSSTTGEYYLTDFVEEFNKLGLEIRTVEVLQPQVYKVMGVNTIYELFAWLVAFLKNLDASISDSATHKESLERQLDAAVDTLIDTLYNLREQNRDAYFAALKVFSDSTFSKEFRRALSWVIFAKFRGAPLYYDDLRRKIAGQVWIELVKDTDARTVTVRDHNQAEPILEYLVESGALRKGEVTVINFDLTPNTEEVVLPPEAIWARKDIELGLIDMYIWIQPGWALAIKSSLPSLPSPAQFRVRAAEVPRGHYLKKMRMANIAERDRIREIVKSIKGPVVVTIDFDSLVSEPPLESGQPRHRPKDDEISRSIAEIIEVLKENNIEVALVINSESYDYVPIDVMAMLDARLKRAFVQYFKEAGSNSNAPSPAVSSEALALRLIKDPEDTENILAGLTESDRENVRQKAIGILNAQLVKSPQADFTDRLRNYLNILKMLRIKGILQGLVVYPFIGIDIFPAQFARALGVNDIDQTAFLYQDIRDNPLYEDAGVRADRISGNLQYESNQSGLDIESLDRLIGGYVDRENTNIVLFLKGIRWASSYWRNPSWLRDGDLVVYSKYLQPLWRRIIRPGDYVVLFNRDANFARLFIESGDFENVDTGIVGLETGNLIVNIPYGKSCTEGMIHSKDSLELGSNCVVLRKIKVASSPIANRALISKYEPGADSKTPAASSPARLAENLTAMGVLQPAFSGEPFGNPHTDKGKVPDSLGSSNILKWPDLSIVHSYGNKALVGLRKFNIADLFKLLQIICNRMRLPELCLFLRRFKFWNTFSSFHLYLPPQISSTFRFVHIASRNNPSDAFRLNFHDYGYIPSVISLPQRVVSFPAASQDKGTIKASLFDFFRRNIMPGDMADITFVPFESANSQIVSPFDNTSIHVYTKDVKKKIVIFAAASSPTVELKAQIREFQNFQRNWEERIQCEGPDATFKTDGDITRYNELHQVNFFVLVRAMIDRLSKEGQLKDGEPLKILDIGAGEGVFLRQLRDRFKYKVEVRGVSLVRFGGELKDVPIDLGDMHKLRYEAYSFHLVVSTFALGYAYDSLKAIEEAYRVLKPGGFASLHLPPFGERDAFRVITEKGEEKFDFVEEVRRLRERGYDLECVTTEIAPDRPYLLRISKSIRPLPLIFNYRLYAVRARYNSSGIRASFTIVYEPLLVEPNRPVASSTGEANKGKR